MQPMQRRGFHATADDVQLRFIPPTDAKLALTQGAVDVWATWEQRTADFYWRG